jgi:F-type H+-transporting ATPase subunit b
MNLVTPDTGLLFWMVVIFGIVFFLLAKFGFPIITSMVDKRNAAIKRSLEDARAVEAQMADIMAEHAQMLEDARKEQTDILRDAAETRKKILADAKVQAGEEAAKILADARAEIAAEKEAAIREVRSEVALLSVTIAEKILQKELSLDGEQQAYIDRMVDETVRKESHS